MSCCYGNGPPEIKAVVTDGLYSESIGGAVVNINSNAKTKEKNGQKKKKGKLWRISWILLLCIDKLLSLLQSRGLKSYQRPFRIGSCMQVWLV